MTDVEQHKNKEFFISVAHEYIKRPGVSELLSYLNQKTDFFSEPTIKNVFNIAKDFVTKYKAEPSAA